MKWRGRGLLGEPVDIFRRHDSDSIEVYAQQSQLRAHYNLHPLSQGLQNQQQFAEQIAMGMRNALAQQNIAMNSAAQALKDLYSQNPYIENLPGKTTWIPPAPLSRRCAYCACHVEPVKDCPHCGAPA